MTTPSTPPGNVAPPAPRPFSGRGSDFADYDFSGQNLTGADFRFANLARANFKNATLVGADFSFSNVSNATFEGADLTNANLSFVNLETINLTGATLQGAKIKYSGVAQPMQAERITLTTVLQQPGLGTVIGMVLGALLVYGGSAIIYFTDQILKAPDPLLAEFYRFIIAQNMLDGVGVFLVAWSLSRWLDRRFSSVWMRHVVLSGAVMVMFVVLNTALYLWLGASAIARMQADARYASEVGDGAPWYVYAASSLVIANVFLYVLRQGRQVTRKLTEQEVQLLNLEKLKTRAELDALQAKINPHFLYNALNSIASLVHDDPGKAEQMTLLLSKLFRYTTGRDGTLFTSLADELEMVKTYLQVEQVRFGERLMFSVTGLGGGSALQQPVSATLLALPVPQFLLQPLVENAVKHGIAKSAGPGRIDIVIGETNGWLTLTVSDSGPDFAEQAGKGYGLRSIQDKLRLLYRDNALLTIENKPYKQVCIQLKISKLTAATAYVETRV